MSTPMIAELHRSMGRIEGKLDSLIDGQKARDQKDAGVEARLRKVENRQHWYSGVAAILGAILGGAGMHTRA